MKHVIIIFSILLISISSQAQFPTQATPTQYSTGWFRQGWPQADSGTILANRLPNFTPRFPGTVILYQQVGVDSSIYYFNGGRWLKLSQFDSASLSNRINLKLNITDTTSRWWGVGKRWVDTVYRVNDSTVGYTINGAAYTFQILGRLPSGGGGSGTVTSVGLSLPSAFNVTPSSITTSGTFAVTGAGTTLQYIRGNGTLATTDTGMIPNFHLKVRSLVTGASPVTFNQTTGIIGINNANTSGAKGAASFTGSFSDNGSGLIDLADIVSNGSCTGCNLNIDSKGRVVGYSDGAGGATNNVNVGAGFRPVNAITQEMRTYFAGFGNRLDTVANANGITWSSDTTRVTGLPSYFYVDSLFAEAGSVALNNIGAGFRWLATPAGNFKSASSSNTILWDSTSTANTLTAKADTSVLATQYDLTQISFTADNGLTAVGNNVQLGGTLTQNTTVSTTSSYFINVTGSNSGQSLQGTNTSTGAGVKGQSTSGSGVYGLSTSLNGVLGVSASGTGLVGESSSGEALNAYVLPSSTNSLVSVARLQRFSTGTAANGIGGAFDFYTQSSGGSAQRSNRIGSSWSNATTGSRTSILEFYGVNNASEARKAALAGNGQWIWDGYPALTAQIDTTTYKPIAIDGSGNVVKMAGWAGTGGGGAGGDTLLSELSDVEFNDIRNAQVLIYDKVLDKWRNKAAPIINVADWGIYPDSTDIRSKLIILRDYIDTTSQSAVLFWPGGTLPYYLSDSVVFTKTVRFTGVAQSGGLHNYQSGGLLPKDRLGPVQLSSTICVLDGKNGIIFDSTSAGYKPLAFFENLTFKSTVEPGSSTGGSFIVLRGMIQDPVITGCTFYGGYVQVDKQSAYYAKVTNNHFSAPQKTGFKMQNLVRHDTGDDLVLGNIFSSGTFNTISDSTTALWWTSGGGLKFGYNKIDACEFNTNHAFVFSIRCENPLEETSDIIISNNSIENWAISAIYMRGIDAPYVRNIQINDNQFAPVGSTGSAIDINSMKEVLVSDNLFRDYAGSVSAPAIKITNSEDVVIGKGHIMNYTSNIDVTGSTNVHIDYMWGYDVAIGSYNTTNIANLNTSLYTTLTVEGRGTSGSFGGGVVEVASKLPDGDGVDVGFFHGSLVGQGRIAAIGMFTDGSTAANRGGEIKFYTKLDGSPTLGERMSIDNAGYVYVNVMDSVGAQTGGCVFRDAVTKRLVLGPCGGGGGSSQWTTSGNNIYNNNTDNVGIGDNTPDFKLDVEMSNTNPDGLVITNTGSGADARPIARLVNNGGDLAQLSVMSSTHGSLPNYALFEATKSFQIGVDQGVASGGSSVINFVTGGYSVAPSLIIGATGTVNMSSLAGSGARMVTADASGNLGTQAIPGGSTTLYTGDGTVTGNRTLTGGNNDLTFTGVDMYTIASNYLIQAKTDGSRTYSSIVGLTGANYWQFGYTTGAGNFTRGNGLIVDTLNNVGLGDVTQTNMPLYSTGNSTYIASGLQSKQGNFYAVTSVSESTTIGLTTNFIVADATSGNMTITLPSASSAFGSGMGIDYVFKRIDNSGNSVTIQRAGSDTVDGGTSFSLTTQWESKSLRAISASSWAVH